MYHEISLQDLTFKNKYNTYRYDTVANTNHGRSLYLPLFPASFFKVFLELGPFFGLKSLGLHFKWNKLLAIGK